MSRIYRCDDILSALKKAQELKNSGKYKYFRGQRKNWPVKSTFARLDEIQQDKSLTTLKLYEDWAYSVPSLKDISKTPDHLIAIAQHYGMPTTFVDFTTSPNVAAFFASSKNDSDDEGCIVCLDDSDLNKFWDSAQQLYKSRPELLTFKIKNLWRLEAQQGVFLFIPFDEIEKAYDFDRILFPASNLQGHLDENEIYPKRKSSLEIELDKFFMQLRADENTSIMRETYKNMEFVQMSSEIKGFEQLLIKSELPPIHSSWISISEWDTSLHEKYESTVLSVTHTIPCVDMSFNETKQYYFDYFYNIISKEPMLRKQAIKWVINKDNSACDLIERLWDGMRNIPYTNLQLAEALSMLQTLTLFFERKEMLNIDCFKKKLSNYIGECIEVEFGNDVAGWSRAFVTSSKLLNIVRDDIDDFVLSNDGVKASQSTTRLLQAIHEPSCMFVFEELCDLFSSQIIPIQILTRTSESAIFFNPTRINLFGLP